MLNVKTRDTVAFVVSLQQILYLVVLFILLILNSWMTAGWIILNMVNIVHLCKWRPSNRTPAPWCSGHHYCTTSFNRAWAQVMCRFKVCSQRVGDSKWWGSLTMVPAMIVGQLYHKNNSSSSSSSSLKQPFHTTTSKPLSKSQQVYKNCAWGWLWIPEKTS